MGNLQTQEEWEADMSVKILKFIRNEIYMDLRFLDIALSALVPDNDNSIKTFATDGVKLYYPSKMVIRVFKNNSGFLDRVYLHSVLHCIFSHLWVGGKRDRHMWGTACDIAVEYTIDGIDKKCTKRALSYLRQQTYKKLQNSSHGISAAVIYNMLEELEPEEYNKLVHEFYTDDHRYWPKQEDGSAMEQPARNNWDNVARQTRQQQQKRGDDNGDGEKVLAAQMRADRGRRSYGDFLRKFSVLREELKSDPDEFDMNFYSYGLRLYKNMPLIEPIESRETRKIQEFAVVIDTSYSTSGGLVKNFLNETFTVLAQKNSFFRDSYIHIIQCDDQVRLDQVIKDREQLDTFLDNFTIVGGGNTDFRPAFEYVNQLIESKTFKNLCGLLYFTDGKGIYPKKKPEYKTAFLFLEDYDDKVPAWAMKVRLEPEEFKNAGEDNEH